MGYLKIYSEISQKCQFWIGGFRQIFEETLGENFGEFENSKNFKNQEDAKLARFWNRARKMWALLEIYDGIVQKFLAYPKKQNMDHKNNDKFKDYGTYLRVGHICGRLLRKGYNLEEDKCHAKTITNYQQANNTHSPKLKRKETKKKDTVNFTGKLSFTASFTNVHKWVKNKTWEQEK